MRNVFWLSVSPTPLKYIERFLLPGSGAEKVAAVSMNRPDAYSSSTTLTVQRPPLPSVTHTGSLNWLKVVL